MIFRRIIDSGIVAGLPFYRRREVRMINLFALIIIAGLLVGATSMFFLGGAYPALAEVISATVTVMIIVLNFKKKYDAATYLFVISINLLIFFINQQYDVSVQCYLYYFPVIFCVALIHDPGRSNKRTALFFFIVVFSFMCSKLLRIEALRNTTVTAEDNKVLLIYNAYLTVILTIFLVYLVVKLINRQNNELILSLNKLRESQLLISNSLKEKEVLLAEIQHRVKNNLAVMSGLLSLQLNDAKGSEARVLLLDAKNRIMSIAMVHERLYQKGNLSQINLGQYLMELTDEVIGSHQLHSKIQLIKQTINLEVSITKAIPTGLIVNEILTNSLKHAFENGSIEPTISLKMILQDNTLKIHVADNGKGFGDLSSRNESSLGVSLIESLALQIDADVVFMNNDGAKVELSYSVS